MTVEQSEIAAVHQQYLDARAEAKKIHEELRADDPRFCKDSRLVSIAHLDGSLLVLTSAFVQEYSDKVLMVFTEHHGFYVYPRDEVVVEEREWRGTPDRVLRPILEIAFDDVLRSWPRRR